VVPQIQSPKSSGPPLRCSVDTLADGHLVVAEGEIDIATAPLFADALDRAIAGSSGPVVIDLAEIAFMDAAGLRVLSAAAADLAGRGRPVEIRRASPLVRRVLDITCLSQFFLPTTEAKD